jgi:hypothetical protein
VPDVRARDGGGPMTTPRQREADQVDQEPGRVEPSTPTARPTYAVNITAINPYRYSTGGEFGHAMYERKRTEEGAGSDYYWQRRAELPLVHARIVRRDGSQRRVGMSYLISVTAESDRVIVTDDDLADGSWAVKIGAMLSADRTIITAAGTAIRDMAHRDAPEREAVARPDVHSTTGHLDLPVRECLPTGYLVTPAGADETEIRARLVEVVTIAARNPKMALVMGASAGAPYVGPLRRQSHWYDMYGEKRMGKSSAQAVAALLWGDPRIGTGIVLGWDTSRIGIGRQLGQLGILPPFLDERAIAPEATPWGEIVFGTCQGSSRLTAEVRGDGVRRSAPWFGVLFSTGNGRLLDRISAGRFGGVPARVIELAAPFTPNAEEADLVAKTLAPTCYGWLGARILATVTVPEISGLLAEAAERIGYPVGGEPRTIAEHLHMAVAGAMCIDRTLGTGTVLADAAAAAAVEHLAERGQGSEHDADRMITAIGESLSARRGAWPTDEEYVELGRPRPAHLDGGPTPGRVELAQHGYERDLFGVRAGQRLYVYPSAWQAIADELGVDSTVALAELYRRGVLHVATKARQRREWTDRPRVYGDRMPGIYSLSWADVDGDDQRDDDQGSPVDPAPVAGPVPLDQSAAGAVEPVGPVEPEALPLDGGPVEPVDQGATGGPCETCRRPGEFCGFGQVADDRAPCILCGRPTPIRSACGVPRTGVCRGTDPAAPVVEPAPVAPAAPVRTTPRGAHPAAAGRAGKQADRLAADMMALDEGRPVRLLSALETTHAPMRRHGGRMTGPYWRPELPGVLGAAHVVTGWHWSREYTGDLVVLDRSGAWVAAASSATVAHGALDHTGPLDEFEGRPGLYQVPVYPWHEEDSLPNPLGHATGETVWVPAPTVVRLIELADAGRWADVTILDSYTGDGVRLTDWTRYVNALRAHAIRTHGRDSDQYGEVKIAFGQAMSLMLGSDDPGRGRAWKCNAQRPDWTHTIQAQASAMLHRWADRCRQVAPEFPPVMLRNVDELVIPAEALPIVTSTAAAGAAGPVGIDPEGIKLGTFKVKGTEGAA